MLNEKDLLHRFIFDNTDIKGELATISQSLTELFGRQSYNPHIQQLLGEFMVAATLLSSSMKVDGRLTLQARGEGAIELMMAEVNNKGHLRATASTSSDDISPLSSLPELIGDKGILCITLEPTQGERYQGLVPLEGTTLAECLESYFQQSAQIPTRLWLNCREQKAAGMLLQRLPQQVASKEANDEAWDNRISLANTLTPEELLQLDHASLLTRLFHEEGVRLLEPEFFSFNCDCSKARCSQALLQLGHKTIKELMEEQELIDVDCQFCGFQYSYNQEDIANLFSPASYH